MASNSNSNSSNGDRTSNGNDSSTLNEDDLEDDYYAMLNVAKDATDKQITQSYHRLGLIYHPDKHKDGENKRNAEILFSKLKKAYEVLINPHKRAIYDSVGVKGLAQEDFQIMVRSKTPQEIREEFERLAREKEQKFLESLTQSHGYFSMHLDASRLFDNLNNDEVVRETRILLDKRELPLISIKNFEMLQSVDLSLTNKDIVTLDAMLNNEGRYGSGTVSAKLRRILSNDTFLDFKATLGGKTMFFTQAYKRLSQNCHGNLSGILNFRNGKLAPTLVGTLTYQLDTHVTGSLYYKTGMSLLNSSMGTSLVYDKDHLNLNVRLELSLKNTHAAVHLSKGYFDNSLRVKTFVQYGYLGATLSYGVEKQLNKFTRIDSSIIVNTSAGVVLNLEIERGPQKFVVPIHLSHEILPSAIFYGTITPIIGFLVVKKLIIDPYLKQKEESEAKQKQEKLKSEIKEKRRLALAAQNLMKETVLRIIEKEGPNGLIIDKAIYGKIQDKDMSRVTINNDLSNEKLVDVRIPLQFLVVEHSLYILNDRSKSLSNLEGFYDPCIGETKSLYVEYSFKNEHYRATFDDGQIIRLPNASHKIQWWSRPFSSVRT